MEHLVKAHDTGMYYTSKDSISLIRETCPECGSWDNIILSYEDGDKDITLEDYFSKSYNNENSILTCTEAGLTKKNIIDNSINHFFHNEIMIQGLLESGVITKEESRKYLKISKQTERKELKRIRKSLRLHLSYKEKRN